MAGWYRFRGRVLTRDGRPLKAHYVTVGENGRDGRSLCDLTGLVSAPGIAGHCKTCEKRRAQAEERTGVVNESRPLTCASTSVPPRASAAQGS